MIETTKAWARRAAQALACVVAFHPQVSWADGFTGAEFATWSKASQDSYIQTSVAMAGFVMAQIDKTYSRCINDRFFLVADIGEINSEMRDLITKYDSTHPSGVILAVIARECGSFPVN